MTTPATSRAAVVAVLTACVGLSACTGEKPANAPTTALPAEITTPATTSVPNDTASTSSTPTLTPSTATLDAKAKAFADAEGAYLTFSASYAEAARAFDTTSLNKNAGSMWLIAAIKKSWKPFVDGGAPKAGMKLVYSQRVKSISGYGYTPGKIVRLKVCAVTNSRFIDKAGKDVTVDPQGRPLAPYVQARSNEIEVVSDDGGRTWKVNGWVQDGDKGVPC